MLINHDNQKGLTLIEMMIAMVLGLFVTAIILTVFSSTVRSNVENMKMIRLNQELRGAMTFMADELKRAGYSADTSNTNFMSSLSTKWVNSSCFLYSYDNNSDGTQDSNEHFGFRLDSSIYQIKWASDADSGCTFGESITDSNMAKITRLYFDISGSVNTDGPTTNAFTETDGVSVYDVTITLTGSTDLPHSSTPNDPIRTIKETIRIRNDAPKD